MTKYSGKDVSKAVRVKRMAKAECSYHGRNLRFPFACKCETKSIRTPKGKGRVGENLDAKTEQAYEKHRQLFRGVI